MKMCSGCDGSMEKIKFMSDDMQETEFFVLEQTTVNEAECLILKETSKAGAAESVYEIVEDDVELSALSKVFEELLEDVEIER